MHRSEARESSRCVDCDGEVASQDRVFALDADWVLCFACAVGRGGVYDEGRDDWVTQPDVADLFGRLAWDR